MRPVQDKMKFKRDDSLKNVVFPEEISNSTEQLKKFNHDVIKGKKTLSIRQVITTLCRAKAWKFTDLAREVGTSKQALNNYMNGLWGTPTHIKIKIAKALEVDSAVIWDLDK